RIFELSHGYPFFVHELCHAATLYNSDPHVFDEHVLTPTMDRFWEHSLKEIEDALADKRQLVRQIIALTSAAKSGLRLEDIAYLLKSNPEAISEVLDPLSHYFPKQGNEYYLL